MLHLSITELHKQFLTKSLLPSSVIRQAVNRIEALSDLNIFVTQSPDLALEQSKQADHRFSKDIHHGLLDGMSIAVKDNFCTKDLKTSCGSLMLDNFPAPYNATVVQRCHDKGAVIVGKTNLDEFAMGSGTIDSYVGPTKNIWGSGVPYTLFAQDETVVSDHSPRSDTDWVVAGGSSGGSAVGVAAGVAMAALGSDTGGSVRIPAAWTGTASIKPSYGRV